MLGLKNKEKEIEKEIKIEEEIEKEKDNSEPVLDNIDSQTESVLEQENLEVQAEENQSKDIQPKEEPAQEEQSDIEQEQDKFGLAHLLGKTESGLKTEFYAYQIKEVMRSVVKSFPQGQLDVEEIEKACSNCVKFGAMELAITPYTYQVLKGIESKFGKDAIKFSAMIDFPYGESSHKARIADVKTAVANGADNITVAFPVKALSFGSIGTEKARLNKLCKVSKQTLGVSIKADLCEEDMKKMLKVIDGTRLSHVMLNAEDASLSTITQAISILSKQKGNKKIFVYSTVKSIDDLSTLLSLKVDKIYTPYLEELGYGLCAKFGINL